MAKKLKIRIPDRKDDILLETTQKGIGWMRRFQAPLTIGVAVVACVAVLVVYGLELERRSEGIAWQEYLSGPAGQEASAYAGLVEKYQGTPVEPWVLLDQAHALSRTGKEEERAASLEIYRRVRDQFGENSLIRYVAEASVQGVEREMGFRLPEAPTPEEEGEAPPAPPGAGDEKEENP